MLLTKLDQRRAPTFKRHARLLADSDRHARADPPDPCLSASRIGLVKTLFILAAFMVFIEVGAEFKVVEIKFRSWGN